MDREDANAFVRGLTVTGKGNASTMTAMTGFVDTIPEPPVAELALAGACPFGERAPPRPGRQRHHRPLMTGAEAMRCGCPLPTLQGLSCLTAAVPATAGTPSSAPLKASVHGCASPLGTGSEVPAGCLRQFKSAPRATSPIATAQSGSVTTGEPPRAAADVNVSGNARDVADVAHVAAGLVRVAKGAPWARHAAMFCAEVGLFTVARHDVILTLDRTTSRTTPSLAILLGVLATSISQSLHLAFVPKAGAR